MNPHVTIMMRTLGCWAAFVLFGCSMQCAHAAIQTVAVFTFDNLTGSPDHAWLGNGFAEELSQKLSHCDRILVRNRRKVSELATIATIDQRKVDQGDAKTLRQLLGCDYFIFGAVQAGSDVSDPNAPLRATARMVDTRTGEICRASQVDGTMKGIFQLQSEMALSFAVLLQDELSEVRRQAILYHGTDSLQAYKFYCEALELLDGGKPNEAILKFRLACDVHPGVLYAEAHYAMGNAYLKSGRKEEMLKDFQADVARLSIIWYDLWKACVDAGEHEKAACAFATYMKYKDTKTDAIVGEKKR